MSACAASVSSLVSTATFTLSPLGAPERPRVSEGLLAFHIKLPDIGNPVAPADRLS
jgi:hypothetical protein